MRYLKPAKPDVNQRVLFRGSARVAGPSAAKPKRHAQASPKHRPFHCCVLAEAAPQDPAGPATSADAALRTSSNVNHGVPQDFASPSLQSECLAEEDGSVFVQDNLEALLTVLPEDIRQPVAQHTNRAQLLEVVLDLGRRPEARFLNTHGGEYLREAVVSQGDLLASEQALGEFGGDNRAGVPQTLHRISAIRNRKGKIVGLTCRVGRAVLGHVDMIRDILEEEEAKSVLFLGRPGVGKTTVIREMARVLADDLKRRVVIVDTSNEIGGDGDVPHPAIGGARRMQVPDPSQQHRVMIEAVENHMPEVVIVDEIGTEAEALACRSIAERGVQLVGTAHGQVLENLMKNPTLSDLIGGIQSVTLGDEEARSRQTQKTVLERVASPTFPLVIEMRQRALWVAHYVEDSVDLLLQGRTPRVQVRSRDPASRLPVVDNNIPYDAHDAALLPSPSSPAPASTSSPGSPVPPTRPAKTGSFFSRPSSSSQGGGIAGSSSRQLSYNLEQLSSMSDDKIRQMASESATILYSDNAFKNDPKMGNSKRGSRSQGGNKKSLSAGRR
ncbi:hypothetical protein WJX73_003675 [Symbiochloris irregularis]|uniref:AAA+ ATPase domain-containing protein n=1 Tax=Symbiochloris irregularis TaxID=706552 RepID=A0AAW1PM18_9CHLO